MIPQDFESWKFCIEEKCGIPLTVAFAQQRLAVYNDVDLPETQRFIERYGEIHYQRVKSWFIRIVDEYNV